jgi:hypothetical protein
MRIGLISDTHNEHQKVQQALAYFHQQQISVVFHAGDVTDLPTLQLFAGFDVWLAKGNMDRDLRLRATAQELFGPGRVAAVHHLAVDGVAVALLHGDDSATLESLIHNQIYAFVIHGHTHTPRDEAIGPTRVINPGTLVRIPTCALLDLETGDLTWLEL